MEDRFEKDPAEVRLAAAAREGNVAAFGQIYRRFGEAVARRISHLVGPDSDPVNDLVQETFVLAYQGLARYRGEAPLSHWLLRIATNVARSHHRRSGRRRRYLGLWRSSEAEREVADSVRRVDETLSALQAVHRALDTLSPRLREAVILFELEGVSLADISAQLAVPLHTAASRVRRGRRQLRSELERAGYGTVDAGAPGAAGRAAVLSPTMSWRDGSW